MNAVGECTRHYYFFVHIMKTGGTTLHARLLRHFVSPPAEVPDTLRARIAEDNQLDMELYEFAQELVASRRLRDSASRVS